MFPSYHDITSRIDEDPTWYTIEGYPRYGEFKPAECSIYAGYSLLMKIQCQDCRREFLIGQDIDPYDLYEFLLDVDLLEQPHLGEIWLPLMKNPFAPFKRDATGKEITRTRPIEEVVKNWGFGDPPNHGCVGDTMGSIECCSIEVWDNNFGRKTEPIFDDDGITKYSVIKEMGHPARLTELEGIDLTPAWWRNDE